MVSCHARFGLSPRCYTATPVGQVDPEILSRGGLPTELPKSQFVAGGSEYRINPRRLILKICEF